MRIEGALGTTDTPRLARGDRLGRPQALRGARARAAARSSSSTTSTGRSRRSSTSIEYVAAVRARRPAARALHGATRPVRRAAGVDGAAAQRDARHARAAVRGRQRDARRASSATSPTETRAAHRRGGRGQPALRRAARRDAGRERRRRARGAADAAGAARRAHRPPRPSRSARSSSAARSRDGSSTAARSRRSCPSPSEPDGRRAPADARPQGADPARPARRCRETTGSASATSSSATPPTTRSRSGSGPTLHERFADWLEAQARRRRAGRDRRLPPRAGLPLRSRARPAEPDRWATGCASGSLHAARAAIARQDVAAAVNLLDARRRARSRRTPMRPLLFVRLGEALERSRRARASSRRRSRRAWRSRAEAGDDARRVARAGLARPRPSCCRIPRARWSRMLEEATAAVAAREAGGDHEVLAAAWGRIAGVHSWRGETERVHGRSRACARARSAGGQSACSR